ncbi:transporter substrate-binding domain-containing protein [Iodobacter fluviatilis]|uniref:Amino acid ABC transporter substrate-binding protein n=1 Tax=Iodobacter fluviatilis TaxID=537 RepID=A0A7G3GBT5_9NEIS|nr:transporter substrate-binding domain-containing protein [Iodobacter fluviatilis]QBC44604.1 amino acid ABC transporter substrate-binding protein [Iodobacter fluviatilis]
MKCPLLLALILTIIAGPALADKLDDIKKAGVLRVAAFDSNPPFGFVNETSRQLVGFDVEIAQAIAKKLGVKLELLATNPANRIPLLAANKVDLVAANFTVTEERRKQVEFSTPYFATGQKFIARKGVLKAPADIAKLLALLANAPDKTKYEISPFALTREYQAIGIARGEERLSKEVNDALLELEKSGQAKKIYDHWFGPKSRAALPRDFKIGDKV